MILTSSNFKRFGLWAALFPLAGNGKLKPPVKGFLPSAEPLPRPFGLKYSISIFYIQLLAQLSLRKILVKVNACGKPRSSTGKSSVLSDARDQKASTVIISVCLDIDSALPQQRLPRKTPKVFHFRFKSVTGAAQMVLIRVKGLFNTGEKEGKPLDDSKIIDLFFSRDETAIRHTAEKVWKTSSLVVL